MWCVLCALCVCGGSSTPRSPESEGWAGLVAMRFGWVCMDGGLHLGFLQSLHSSIHAAPPRLIAPLCPACAPSACAQILRPLVLECPPDSPAPDLFNIPLEMAQCERGAGLGRRGLLHRLWGGWVTAATPTQQLCRCWLPPLERAPFARQRPPRHARLRTTTCQLTTTRPLPPPAAPLDPELVYSAVGYAGQTSADPADVVDAQWAAYRNTFTNFSNPYNSFIHSAHRPAASCSRAAHFGLGSPGRPPPRAHVRCWRGVPSDRGPLKACAEAGKRGSALLHAWRLEQNRVPPSCGRSFRPTVYGRSHGTRRHGVWAQACCRRRRARGAARRRRRHAATPPCCRAAAVVSCQKPTATATGLGGTAFRSTACCRRRRRGAACGGTAFGSTACCRCRRRRGAACGGGGSARGNPPALPCLPSTGPRPALHFVSGGAAHCSLLIAHRTLLNAHCPISHPAAGLHCRPRPAPSGRLRAPSPLDGARPHRGLPPPAHCFLNGPEPGLPSLHT